MWEIIGWIVAAYLSMSLIRSMFWGKKRYVFQALLARTDPETGEVGEKVLFPGMEERANRLMWSSIIMCCLKLILLILLIYWLAIG